MKTIITVLIITVLLLTVAGAASAAAWEMTGDFAIVGVELDAWNAQIDTLNANVENYGAAAGAEYETMDNIDRVPAWKLGVENRINENYTIKAGYEYIPGEISYSVVDGNNTNGSIAVQLNGFTGGLDYHLNENWTVGAGIGFYNGTKETTHEGTIAQQRGLEDTEDDLDGTGYRAGVGYERSFNESLDFNLDLNYFYMELDDEDEEIPTQYSNGMEVAGGLTYSF
ncbi:outer membrane protein [Halanaerobium saccharolyticum]|uniref:outer membrane protein n=1 Tax=Halanaerobium saccharolyticum TaxID=43595 RepID=UPI003FCED324